MSGTGVVDADSSSVLSPTTVGAAALLVHVATIGTSVAAMAALGVIAKT